MDGLSPGRRLLKLFHPEGIPWPGSVIYNAISASGVFQRHYALLAADIVDRCPAGSLLDIGTGPGWLLLKLHQQAPGLRLEGVDVSRAMVAKARENLAAAGPGDVGVSEGNVCRRLPYEDCSFDIVVSTGSLHHWKEPAAALNEIHRVLKPGAPALLYDLVNDTPPEVLAAMVRECGRLKTWLFWLHGFEEPFYSRARFEALPATTPFRGGRTRFVGVLCCLELVKEAKHRV